MPADRQHHPNDPAQDVPRDAAYEDWAERDTRQYRWERAADGPEMKTWAEGERPRHHDRHPLDEPPSPAGGSLVPGSRFSEVQWARAAYMLAAGCSMLQVARTMGCTRMTVWRAYHASPAFRVRIAWERGHLEREARSRVRSLGRLVAVELERSVMRGDMRTVRWLAERLGVVRDLQKEETDPAAFREEFPPDEAEVAAMADRSEEERPYAYPGHHPDDTLEPLPVEDVR